MGLVPVVLVESDRQLLGAPIGRGIGPVVSPLPERALEETLGLAIFLGCRACADVLDAQELASDSRCKCMTPVIIYVRVVVGCLHEGCRRLSSRRRRSPNAIWAGSILKHQIWVTGIHVPDVSPARTVGVTRFIAFGARIDGVGIGGLERAMPNINCSRATTSRTAIRIRPTINLKHACCNMSFPRLNDIVGATCWHDRYNHSRGQYNKVDI